MSAFKNLMIDMCKLQSDNAKAQAKHNELQNALNENPIYPKDRHDSDADELSRPLDWQEEQARDIEEMENDLEYSHSENLFIRRIQEIE